MKKWGVLFLLLSSLYSYAQKNSREMADSLLAEIALQKNDTLKARLYNRLFNELASEYIDEARKYARIGLAHTQKMKWPKGIAVFQTNLGSSYSTMGNYDSSLYYFNAALATHSKANDKFNMASTYNNMGVAAQNIRSDYALAATYIFKALKLAEEIADSTLISVSLSNAARVYAAQKNYTKALEYDTKALLIREKKGTPNEIAASLESIGTTYYLLKDEKKAAACFHKAEIVYKTTGNFYGLASVYTSLPLVYGTDYRSIIETRIKAKKLWDDINPLHPNALTNTGNLGLAYLDIVRYDTNHVVKYGDIIPDNKEVLLQKASEHLNAAIQIAIQSGDISTKSFFTGILAEVQEYKGDFKNAYFNYKSFKETEDSLFSQENKNKIAAAESQRQIDKKNNELEINKLTLSNQRRTMVGLVGGLVLLAIIGTLLYKQSRQRKKTNVALSYLNNELDKANKVKAKFFAILSHDLRSPLSRILNLLHLQKNNNDSLSNEQLELLQRKIKNSTESLLETMDAMLLWSKSQMENFSLTIKTIPAAKLFDYISNLYGNISNLHFQFDNPENVLLETDENFIQVIMNNLTANAINAAENRDKIVIIWKAWKEGGKNKLSITDNGTGLNKKQTENIIKDSTVKSGKNGLGLYLIYDIAKIIKADISIGVVNENGSTFIISL